MPRVRDEMKLGLRDGGERPGEGSSSPRIQTQIHRRNKARADESRTPLADEWEAAEAPPANLKRPPGEMRKA